MYLFSVMLVFITQIYFIHHIVTENAGNIRTITDVDHIDDASIDVYKMITFSKDEKKIPSILHSFKEESDSDFQMKFSNKTCDPLSAASSEKAVIGLKR